jgi:imidazolonepropionase
MRNLGIVANGEVLVRDGVIHALGSSGEASALASPDVERIDATGMVVAPGFVDAHTHPVFAGEREDEYEMRAEGLTYREIALRGGGIRSTVRRTRAASEEELFKAALPRVGWLLEHGTTTIEAKSGYGLTVDDELKILRVIRRLDAETPLDLIPTFLGAHEIPDEFRGQGGGRPAAEDYLRLVIDEMFPRVVRDGLARYADVFCEGHVFSVDEARQVMLRGRELGLGIRVHAEQLSLTGGARVAAEIGAATADHLEWIDDAGIDALKSAGVLAVLLPGAVFNLGLSKYAPARNLIEKGVGVVLATDFNPGSSPTPSMQMILSIACTQMSMTPSEAFTSATINAAYSLGLGEKIGSLEKGKQADIAIFFRPDYRQIPYFFGVNHVAAVIKSGRVVMDRRRREILLS